MSKEKIKNKSIKDKAGLVDQLVNALHEKGAIRLTNFGSFKVVSIKGRKVFDFKKRQMRPVPAFKQVVFTSARGLRDMLNSKVK